MTTIVVLSDTHGNRSAIDNLTPVLSECDMIIHLGDTSQDGNYIKKTFPDKTHLLNGNCDLMGLGEDEKIIDVEGVKIFCCHGHKYSVKQTLTKLAARTKEVGATLALYGHSHRADECVLDGVTLINPGTMSRYSRQSYCYLVISGDKAVAKTVFTV